MNGGFKLFIILSIIFLLIGILNFIIGVFKRKMLKKAKSKKQVSNIKIFTRILNVIFILLILFVAFFSYLGSWTGLGIFAGLITAGLGFALQKPITGIAAWLMIIIKRPFSVGDRIMIGDVSGDVYDISLTHVYIDEVGGNISSDQISGRNIMIPNHLLFEHNIINYTLTNDYVLGEVAVSITYESNLDKAEKIVKESTIKFIEEYSRITKEPVTRMNMDPSCMNLRILFFAPVRVMQEIKSNITKEIYNQIKKEKDVEIAYPHTEIVFKNKNLFKK